MAKDISITPDVTTLAAKEASRAALREALEASHTGPGRMLVLPNNPPLDVEKLAEQLLPHFVSAVVEQLRQGAPSEAKALAEAAKAEVGLDDLPLYALAGWLEDRGLPDLGGQVRRLALSDGDLLVMQPQTPMNQHQREYLREGASALQDGLQERGINVFVLVLPHGVDLHHIKSGKKKEGG